jgi:hypothetical protein
VDDNAVRLLAAVDLAAICRWLKLDVDGEPERLSESLSRRRPRPRPRSVGRARGRREAATLDDLSIEP